MSSLSSRVVSIGDPRSVRLLVEFPQDLLFSILAFLPLECLPSVFSVSSEFGALSTLDAFWEHFYDSNLRQFDEFVFPLVFRDPFSRLAASRRVKILASRIRTAGHIQVPFYDDHTTTDDAFSPTEPALLRAKCAMVGSCAVGKSSVLRRLLRGDFLPNGSTTLMGVAFPTHEFRLDPEEGQHPSLVLRGEMWDTAGQERFRCLSSLYFRGVSAFVFVFDVTRRETFAELRDSFERVLEGVLVMNQKDKERNWDPAISYVLLGNKVDLLSTPEEEEDSLERYCRDRFETESDTTTMTEEGEGVSQLDLVSREEIDDLMAEFAHRGCFGKYFETSAKTGENVELAFDWLFRYVLKEWFVRGRDDPLEVLSRRRRMKETEADGMVFQISGKKKQQSSRCRN